MSTKAETTLSPDANARRLASVLKHAHASVIGVGEPPQVVRDLVAGSWRRSLAAGVDPEAPAPRILDDAETCQRFRRHKFGEVFSRMQSRLYRVTHDGAHLAAFSDADGMLLWADGTPRMLEAAVRPHFLPGHSYNEAMVGTNAIGTALALGHPVQIFSAEHFTRRLHAWTCVAAPVHDPASGAVLGVLNLSSPARAGHADTVSLVDALARTAELELAVLSAAADERLRARFLRARDSHRSGGVLVNGEARVLLADPPAWIGRRLERPAVGTVIARLPDASLACWERFGSGFVLRRVDAPRVDPHQTMVIRRLGPGDVVVRLGDREIRLSPRHSEIVLALARHPAGLRPDELAAAVYGVGVSPITLRVELSRLRGLLGPVVSSGPYRLDADTELFEADRHDRVAT